MFDEEQLNWLNDKLGDDFSQAKEWIDVINTELTNAQEYKESAEARFNKYNETVEDLSSQLEAQKAKNYDLLMSMPDPSKQSTSLDTVEDTTTVSIEDLFN